MPQKSEWKSHQIDDQKNGSVQIIKNPAQLGWELRRGQGVNPVVGGQKSVPLHSG
jgi:hypothetical protein